MNSITNEIVAIKTEVRERNWEEMSLACRQSGLSVKEWCRQNGINASTYYVMQDFANCVKMCVVILCPLSRKHRSFRSQKSKFQAVKSG